MATERVEQARRDLPIVVIGAGPVGLVAAAHLVSRGARPLVLEAGDSVGAAIRRWGHVRLFTPWKYLTEPLTRGMLADAGWVAPAGDDRPTGAEFVARFLEPIAALPALADHIRLGRRVVSVSRRGFDKVRSGGRDEAPFDLVVRRADGCTERHLARAVIDASGTYSTPNPMGAGGLPVEGEAELMDRIRYGIPDVFGTERSRYEGRTTLVLGSGHSAFNAVLDLARLVDHSAATEVVWAIRRKAPGQMFGGGDRDALPARGNLGQRLRQLVDRNAVNLLSGFRVERLERTTGGILVHGGGERTAGPVDEIVVTTGFRPDLEMLRELRLSLDARLEAPAALAPLIDPNLHSCGTVYPHGYEVLKHPEPGLFVVGMKSYGRAPTFLMLTGYEQVRSVVCALTDDFRGAREVRLELPETGVCATDTAGSGCCTGGEEATGPIPDSCGVSAACTTVETGSVSPPARGLPVVAGAMVGGCCG